MIRLIICNFNDKNVMIDTSKNEIFFDEIPIFSHKLKKITKIQIMMPTRYEQYEIIQKKN